MDSQDKDRADPPSSAPLDNTSSSEPGSPAPAITLNTNQSYPTSPNPWKDDSAAPSRSDSDDGTKPVPAPLPITNPSSFDDDALVSGFKADSSTPPIVQADVSKEVLEEFDPLAVSLEEKAAHEAWESSEGHPPPPRTPSPPPPPPDKLLQPISAPASPETAAYNAFPSLAAIAKSFSIPNLARPRPVSLDTAKPVPSPATLSSFAAQQATPRSEDGATAKLPSRSGTPRSGGSRPDTPGSSRSGNASPTMKGEQQFDFQKFLDQMKSRSAEPVSKYLRSFLSNFAKRTFTVNDQVKIINDFLNFISVQMRTCDVWKNASEAEFDNSMEGMEKLVMNRLYEFTFTPQVARSIPPRPITADDLERDRVLSQRIALFGWLEEKHLIFLRVKEARELLKINHYKAPRDKLICVLNCCKVIFGLLRHLKKEEGADSFVPILIFVVLKANPEHLLSNVEFINRFRNPAKLQSEAGYYLSSLMGAVSFIETMDHTSLSNITQDEFEKNKRSTSPNEAPHAGEESAQPLSMSTPGQTISEDAKRLLQKTGDTISKPLNAIGRIFSEALRTRANASGSSSGSAPPAIPYFTHPDAWPHQQIGPKSAGLPPQTPYGPGEGAYSPQVQTPYKPRVRKAFTPEDTPSRSGPYTNQPVTMGPTQPFNPQQQTLLPPRVQTLAGSVGEGAHISRTPTPNLDLAGVQAQIDAATEQAAAASKATLVQIFPTVDGEIIEWVLEANEGDLGKSIEALLEMSSGS
ncbi:hypothetical protein BDQ17DRAFT_1389729 [Cyathus striatus]|nr:hypothetical protein BDQ17DRAFT_1389729 [Cyathus striatus]